MDEQLERIAGYLRGQRLGFRSDDPRQWADYLDTQIQPKLEELAKLKQKKTKEAA